MLRWEVEGYYLRCLDIVLLDGLWMIICCCAGCCVSPQMPIGEATALCISVGTRGNTHQKWPLHCVFALEIFIQRKPFTLGFYRTSNDAFCVDKGRRLRSVKRLVFVSGHMAHLSAPVGYDAKVPPMRKLAATRFAGGWRRWPREYVEWKWEVIDWKGSDHHV